MGSDKQEVMLMSKIKDLEEKIKNTEWEIKQMKGVFSYFKREAKKATSQEDIEEMGIIVDDIKIQIRILSFIC